MENELEQLGERIAEQAAHLDAATHRLLADLRAFDARGGWHAQGAASCAHWLARTTHNRFYRTVEKRDAALCSTFSTFRRSFT